MSNNKPEVGTIGRTDLTIENEEELRDFYSCESVFSCINLGGKILEEPKNYGEIGKCGVVQDPAGAAYALFEPKE
jgi:hypothetical protein